MTCDLQAVPWDQALDIVLRYNRMGKTIEGNVLRIAPMTVLTREDADQRKLKESKELSGPVQVKTITLSYSKAKDVSALLKTKISSRGEIVIDERTNTLIVSDVKDKLDLLEKLIAVLDTPTPAGLDRSADHRGHGDLHPQPGHPVGLPRASSTRSTATRPPCSSRTRSWPTGP